jgi:hypothetical protein
MDQETVMNYVVGCIVLLALTVGLISMLFGKLVDMWDAFWNWWGRGVQKAIHTRPVKSRNMSSNADSAVFADDEPEPLGSNEFPLLNGLEPQTNRSENPAELYLNAAEVAALYRMIEHNKTAAKPSKSSTIQAGFGVSRGGSSAYTRASLIYDTLFGAPALAVKYRQRTPEQEALRKQLNLR